MTSELLHWTLFELASWLSTMASLSLAFVLGALIGFERQVRQRTAGLRTNTLVAVGAAVFVDLAVRFYSQHGGSPSPMQVIAYVVSGIGFLGAGAIMKEGSNVSGLNTAATLWCSGAVGCCAGAKMFPEAVLATVFVLAANTLLRPVVNRINRRPMDDASTEAAYTVHLVCTRALQSQAREKAVQSLEAAHYPVRDICQHTGSDNATEIELSLYATAVNAKELDAIAQQLEKEAGVSQAYWKARSDE